MVFKVEISNLEKILENIFSFLKTDSHTIRCKSPNLDKSPVHALIIYSPKETKIRCARYDKDYRKCRDPQLEKDADCETLPFCIYIDAKYKV